MPVLYSLTCCRRYFTIVKHLYRKNKWQTELSLGYLYIDDLVPNERLQEDADEAHEAVLHVSVADGLARGDAVADVQVHEVHR
jgi:hypothetical protein